MAAIDASWWGLFWWSWLLVACTAASLAAAVVIAVVNVRRDRARASRRRPGMPYYLDDNAVMDLYYLHGGKYKEALENAVFERIINSTELKALADFAPVSVGGKKAVNSEVVRIYLEKDKPITVIGIVIDVLDRAGDIVDVDLFKQEVTANRALENALGTDRQPATVRLRSLKTFVSISGEFQKTKPDDPGTNPDITTFKVPYGDPSDPGCPAPVKGPHVNLTCTTTGLRRTAPIGTFPARCLGLVEGWDPGTSLLTVLPIAIFN